MHDFGTTLAQSNARRRRARRAFRDWSARDGKPRPACTHMSEVTVAAPMDIEAASTFVRELLDLVTRSRVDFGSGADRLLADIGGRELLTEVDATIQRRLVSFSAIAVEAAPGIGADRVQIPSSPTQWPWADLERKCHLVLGALEDRERIAEILGPRGPALSTSQLQQDVWHASASFFDHKHFNEAVLNASRAVNALLQDKLGRRDISETRLVQEAWSTDAPQPGRPRLRVPGVARAKQPDLWKDLHVGAMQFGVGLFMRIRNVLEHAAQSELAPSVAIEFLAGFSSFARWIEEATVETA